MQEEVAVLAYLDAHVFQDGECFADFLGEPFMEGVRKEAAETGGWTFHKIIPVDAWAAAFYNVYPTLP